MAQAGYTPISIYYSATATNVPTAGNLVAGELAINTNDGKLYYKDSTGVVQQIAQSGTLPATKGGTGLTSVGTLGNVLTSNGTTWVSQAASGGFTSGTLMLFQQTAAPTGWTKQTTHDNKALRVVSGAASSGGTTGFTTVFTNQTPTITTSGLSAGATTLTTAQIPSHTHTTETRGNTCTVGNTAVGSNETGGGSGTATSNSTGGGNSHTHSISGTATSTAITLNVQYVDLIIASKD
jgi:hypothetical protein